jgi:hypothetical protein
MSQQGCRVGRVKLETQEIASFRYPPGEPWLDQMKAHTRGEVEGPSSKRRSFGHIKNRAYNFRGIIYCVFFFPEGKCNS